LNGSASVDKDQLWPSSTGRHTCKYAGFPGQVGPWLEADSFIQEVVVLIKKELARKISAMCML
jgi:hypothetical protein